MLISSRSTAVKARAERLRAGGRTPPQADTYLRTGAGDNPIDRAIARNDCPDRHCDHSWSCCSIDNPNDCTPTASQTTTR